MGVTKSQLIGRKVYNPDGGYVGEIQDVAFSLEEPPKVTLVVKTLAGSTLEVEWEKVSAAKDIVILKEVVEVPKPAVPSVPTTQPQVTPTPTPTPTYPQRKEEERGGWRFSLPFGGKKEEGGEQKICPYCGKPAVWVPQYKRWWCPNCQRYI